MEPGIHGEKTYVAFLLQGGLGLPDREYYVSAEPRMQALMTRYQEYIGRVMKLAGFDRAEQRAIAVMALRRHAQTQPLRRSPGPPPTPGTRADFARRAPGMDWSAFFAAAGLAKQETFVAWQPSAVTGLAALVGSEPLEAWQDYLRFQVIDAFADVLPHAFAEQAMAMQGAVTGQPQPSPRAQRALAATQVAMSDAVGRMYAERYFPPEPKARVEAIVTNVIAAFRHRVEVATWMSPETRAIALATLKTLYFRDWLSANLAGLFRLGGGRRRPGGHPPRCGPQLPLRDSPVGQGSRPEGMVDRAADGRCGASSSSRMRTTFPRIVVPQVRRDGVGRRQLRRHRCHRRPRSCSHFVDMLGAEWDAEGRMRHWWTPEDESRFQALVEPLVNQFSAYEPFPDLRIDGKRTQTENIADLAGLAAAFDAYRGTLGDRATDKAYVRQQDREFFIGFARSWRSKMSDEGLRAQLATDSHAPERYRIATVRNIDAWYDAFGVEPGQRLYLEPKARVRVW